MNIFFKYVLKSMVEKKGRLILLIIAISMSVGLFVCSSGVIDIAIESNLRPMTESFENKEISIYGKNNQKFFSADDINEVGIKDLIKEIYMSGRYLDDDDNTIRIVVRARENKYIKDYKFTNGNLDDFSGSKCIVSKRIADERNLNVGDKVNTIIGGQNRTLEVAAISAPRGVFYSDVADSFTVIVPYSYLSEELGAKDKYSVMYADGLGDSVDDNIEEFNDANKSFEAAKLIDNDDLMEQASSFTSMLYSMLVIVVIMSSIIIYGAFKLTITERLPIIGTFLSQGATIKTVENILLFESVVYGVIGGIIGDALGIGGLKLINYFISPLRNYGIIESLSINYSYIALGIVFSVVLAVVSALVPVKRIRKLQVKDVILNNVNVSMHTSIGQFIAGLILLLISIIIAFGNNKVFVNISPIGALLGIIGVILIYPKVIDVLSKVIFKVLRGKSKSLVFALNNLRTSKVLLGNISLMVIALSSIFIISSLTTSIQTMLKDCYTKLNFDIAMSHISAMADSVKPCVKLIEEDIENIDGVDKDSFQEDYYTNVRVEGDYKPLTCIDAEKYREYNGYIDFNSDENKEMYDDFINEEKSVIISDNMLRSMNKTVGDYVTFDLNGKSEELKIIGRYDGKLYNMGYTMFMKNTTLENLFGVKGRTGLTFRTTKDQQEVKDSIKFLSKKYGVSIQTKADMKKVDEENNKMIVSILSIFSYLSIIIAALGILNNIIIGFLQRKRELAVLTSVGMSIGKRNKMLVFESILSVIWAFVITLPFSFVLMKLISKLTEIIHIPLEVKMDFSYVPGYFIGTLIIILLATIPVILKNRKLSIINELKYE